MPKPRKMTPIEEQERELRKQLLLMGCEVYKMLQRLIQGVEGVHAPHANPDQIDKWAEELGVGAKLYAETYRAVHEAFPNSTLLKRWQADRSERYAAQGRSNKGRQ